MSAISVIINKFQIGCLLSLPYFNQFTLCRLSCNLLSPCLIFVRKPNTAEVKFLPMRLYGCSLQVESYLSTSRWILPNFFSKITSGYNALLKRFYSHRWLAVNNNSFLNSYIQVTPKLPATKRLTVSVINHPTR